MICPPCRRDEHYSCDNRLIRTPASVDIPVLDFTQPEITKTRCACQHHPHGSSLVPHPDLTSRTESGTLQS